MKILLTVMVFGVTMASMPVAEAQLMRGCVGKRACDPGYFVAPPPSYIEPAPAPYQPSPADIAAQRSNEINNAGNAHYQRGNYQEAVRSYQQALQAAPGRDNTVIRVNLGRAQHMLALAAFNAKNYAEAIRQFEQAAANNPNEKVTRDSLQVAREQLANEALARKHALDLANAKRQITALTSDFANPSGAAFDNGKLPFEFLTQGEQPPNNPQVNSSTATAQNLPANDRLFEKGDKDSAPVPVTPRDAKLDVGQDAKTQQPPAQQKTVPAAATNKTPLLTGPALEAAKDRAKAEAALQLGLNLWAAKDLVAAKKYLAEALSLNPNCKDCRDALARASTEDDLNLLFFPGRSPAAGIDPHLFAARRNLLEQKSMNDHVLTAFQYGKGDWDAGLRYLNDLRSVSPNDKDIQDALVFARSLRTVVEAAERTTK